ncbi:hypothetical protein IQ07DRAFT_503996 [Pyrenochaeta sp. DS3sAY3a]|nr:hypothetical protein IQ07DRAFT_503996 [Pyrenochaeta sp. DS3sAY3a]
MQRGRPNRQPRPNDDSTRGRGTSTPRGLGRGRGRPRGQGTFAPRPRHADPDLPRVPAHSSITPGSGVSIILKEDQASGHQVRGIVAELLTRGDHPRGVKVRLRDGRVGRVQRLVSEGEGLAGEAVVGGAEAGLGRNGEGGGGGGGARGGGYAGRGRGRGGRIERDVREEDGYLYDKGRAGAGVVDAGYFAALEEADRRHEEGKGGMAGLQSEVVKCPVCGTFEGDERAVAHHVEGHFAE